MQKLQRKAGLLLKRSADDAEVALLLKELDEGDRILKIVRYYLLFSFGSDLEVVYIYALIYVMCYSDN
jgi:hypothetical protein